ncbi:uncharacterized protein LOC134686636 [Mytilus trossulus]|uniref:uncharacterized protein LOC134686636 n=1 Tax=Mytilus trossulus TaxID=6551 RepID=UPI0030079C8E
MNTMSSTTVNVPGKREGTLEPLSFSSSTENILTMNTMSTTAVNHEPTEFSSSEDTVTMNTMSSTTVNVPGKREATLEPLLFSPSSKNIRTMNTMSTTTGKVTEEAYTTKRASRNGSIQRRSVLLWNLGCFIMSVWAFSV